MTLVELSKQVPEKKLVFRVLALLCLLVCHSTDLWADNIKSYRTDVGLKLFKTLVSADQNLLKKAGADGSIKVALLYVNDLKNAQKLQEELSSSWTSIRKTPVSMTLMTVAQLKLERPPVAAAIFVTQELLENEMKEVIRYSLENQIVTFSPFEGDVESGVLAGLSVQATVRPLINRASLEKGGYKIKPFYLKVAKYYD